MQKLFKRLKFAEPLPELILNGTKTSTWRINDDKNISVGDTIILQTTKEVQFGQATVTNVKITTLGNLSEDDKRGHETFTSNDEMLKTYSRYYNIPVTLLTEVKIITFKLI